MEQLMGEDNGGEIVHQLLPQSEQPHLEKINNSIAIQ